MLIHAHSEEHQVPILSSGSVPNVVPLPKSVPPAVAAGDLSVLPVEQETCSTCCKNCLLFQLSLCCDGKGFVFTSALFCNIKIFSTIFFVASLQQARYALRIGYVTHTSKITIITITIT